MSKKKKTIIGGLCIFVLLASIVITVIFVNLKRFNITADKYLDFNNHSKMNLVEIDDDYLPEVESSLGNGNLYNNGLRKITNTLDNKWGLYSYTSNKFVVEANYKSIHTISNNIDSGKSYFRLNTTDNDKLINIVDEKGEKVDFLEHDTTKQKTYADIKVREIDLHAKKNSVNTSIKHKFTNQKQHIVKAEYIDTYFKNDLYCYEVWNLTSSEGIVYKNLYKIHKDQHQLVQTLNNELGIALDSKNLDITILNDGTPVFTNTKEIKFDNVTQATVLEIYDIDFDLKGSATIQTSLEKDLVHTFRLGDYIFMQFASDATENKHDFYETNNILGNQETAYYKLKTYKFSLKNGDFSLVDFDYIITNVRTLDNHYAPSISNIFDNVKVQNNQTLLVTARKIENKKLEGQQNLLLNDKLQTKPLNYEFNHLTKINSERYIASIDNQSDFNLIDEDYNLIANLADYNNIFATNNALIVSDSNYSYVCNADGIVIKKYHKENITNLHHKDYYLSRTINETDNSIVGYNYYLESLGLKEENPLYTYSLTQGYSFQNRSYDDIRIVVDQTSHAYSLLIASKFVDNSYTYEFYTIEGDALTTVTGISVGGHTPQVEYFNEDYVVITVGDSAQGQIFYLDR